MTKVLFSEMSLTPKVEHAVSLMGFDYATPVQYESIPIIRTGVDVIARSQTGTGKTVAFAIPAIEKVDTHEEKPTIQVLILCPTRELAVQANEEIQKLARFKEGIRSVAIYGGAPIDKQFISLRRSNIVVGTPGRVMDHMRRKTIRLNNLKMIVLDEADEMLNMGFREDIETILTDTPEDRQTILFSATMPPAILKIANKYQKSPTLIEIDKSQVTIENIEQKYIGVPHAAKKEALFILLQYYQPNRAIIFCGTKKMADELTAFLTGRGVSAESIHSDIRQAQRTATMRDFKAGKTTILIATDIAARGIDVNDVDYVINFDIPTNTEYYVHRIGRTGRAGKDGCSITICSSKREISEMRQIAAAVKSEIKELILPTADDIQNKGIAKASAEVETQIQDEANPVFARMVNDLIQKGYPAQNIAEAVLALHYKELSEPVMVSINQIQLEIGRLSAVDYRRNDTSKLTGQYKPRLKARPSDYKVIVLDIGASSRISVNHIVGAITDRAGISGKEIGKVEISENQSLVEIAPDRVDQVLQGMEGTRICGKPIHAFELAVTQRKTHRPKGGASRAPSKGGGHGSSRFNTPAKNRSARGKQFEQS